MKPPGLECEHSTRIPGPSTTQEDSVVALLPWSKPRNYVVRPGFDGAIAELKTLLLPGSGARSEAAVSIRVKNVGAPEGPGGRGSPLATVGGSREQDPLGSAGTA